MGLLLQSTMIIPISQTTKELFNMIHFSKRPKRHNYLLNKIVENKVA